MSPAMLTVHTSVHTPRELRCRRRRGCFSYSRAPSRVDERPRRRVRRDVRRHVGAAEPRVEQHVEHTAAAAPGAASRTKQQPNWKQAIRDSSGVMWAAVVPGVCLPARPSPGANMNLGSASKHAS